MDAIKCIAAGPVFVVLGLSSLLWEAGERLFRRETREEVMKRLYPGSFITVQSGRYDYMRDKR